MRNRVVLMLFALLGATLIACGGGDDEPSDGDGPGGSDASPAASSGDGSNGGSNGNAGSGGSSDPEAAPEPIGPVAVNTIQIGDETWTRTLPMTSGQCFLYEDDGTLPTSAVVWGPLDGDDLSFSANYNQDGSFESEVRGENFFWVAGPRGPGVDDLEIELDFDTLTVTGEGTFHNLHNGEIAAGSFHFQCEPEDQ